MSVAYASSVEEAWDRLCCVREELRGMFDGPHFDAITGIRDLPIDASMSADAVLRCVSEQLRVGGDERRLDAMVADAPLHIFCKYGTSTFVTTDRDPPLASPQTFRRCVVCRIRKMGRCGTSSATSRCLRRLNPRYDHDLANREKARPNVRRSERLVCDRDAIPRG